MSSLNVKPAVPKNVAPAAGVPARGSYPLDEERCRAVLRDIGWGVLAAVEGDSMADALPFSVPVGYAFDGDAIYVATRPGRKLRALEAHPVFSLTILDVERFDRWRSVIVSGRPVWLSDPADRALAIRAFAGQRRPGGMRLTRRDTQRLLLARVMRMDVREVSGRGCGAWPEVAAAGAGATAPAPATPGSDAAEADAPNQLPDLAEASATEVARVMDDVRRIVKALHGAAGEAKRDLGVSAAQLFVLRQVAVRPGQSMGELALGTHTTQSSVSEVVGRLGTMGLVERRPSSNDRRRAELTLTPAGRALLRRAPDTVQERLIAGLARLPEWQRQAVADGMDAWLAEAGLATLPPTMFLEGGRDEPAPTEPTRADPRA